ncbi:MAG: ABC transporter substrate-binding protein, partial [Planctomycetota bacterium]
VLLPLQGPDGAIGRSVLKGINLAVEEVNAGGGFRGKPFRTVVRPDVATWGASSNSMVGMAYDHGVWGVIGAVDGASTHVMLRVALKTEIAIVSTADTDPTLTETRIPWLVRVVPDDRQACYVLAKEAFVRRRLRRVAILRTNERYGRMGTGEFADAGRRLGTPLVADLRFDKGGHVPKTALERLRAVRADGILLWGTGAEMGKVAATLRQEGIKAPLFGPDRMLEPSFLARAGAAAEGATAAVPFDPATVGEEGRLFRSRFRKKHGVDPDHHAAYGYDGARLLMAAVGNAGLNRALIRDELHRIRTHDGVTGPMRFDATMNNLGYMTLATVNEGKFDARAR